MTNDHNLNDTVLIGIAGRIICMTVDPDTGAIMYGLTFEQNGQKIGYAEVRGDMLLSSAIQIED